MRPLAICTSLLVAVCTAAIAAPALEGGQKFTTTLSGAAEVNSSGVPNQGDPDGAGTARIIVNPGQARVCWEIETSNINAVVGAHIHRAPAGQNGGVVVPLSAAQNSTTSDCRDVTRALADAIRRSPSSFYVNVHTVGYGAGAIRGQLG